MPNMHRDWYITHPHDCLCRLCRDDGGIHEVIDYHAPMTGERHVSTPRIIVATAQEIRQFASRKEV